MIERAHVLSGSGHRGAANGESVKLKGRLFEAGDAVGKLLVRHLVNTW